jgi:hypothetical protein
MHALTVDQVKANIKAQEQNRHRDIRICTMQGPDKQYFFADGHGYAKSHLLPGNWVPCSGYLPMEVVPRPGLEDGIIATLEQYMFIFYNDKTMVDPETLIETE